MEWMPTRGEAVPIDLGIPGVALVQRRGADLVRYTSGSTGGEPDAAITLGTRFQLASVSKQFTAAAVLVLLDRGLLSTEDRLVELLEGCPDAWDAVTVHHLLCHTAGLVHWKELPTLDLTAPCTHDALFRHFADVPLLHEPGERYAYSSPGYVLLAWIVERVSGVPYREFLARELFAPLGLTSTLAGNGARAADLAAPRNDGKAVASFELDVVGMGAGDLWSTVGDLARWDEALLGGQLLGDATCKAMFMVHARMEEEEVAGVRFEGYGYGWFLADVGGHRLFFHTGDNAGFQSINAILPDDDARFMVLTNDASADLLGVSLQLLAAALSG